MTAYSVRTQWCRPGTPGIPDVSEGSILNITPVPSSRARSPRHHLLVILTALSIIGPAFPRGVGAAEQERIVALGESNSETQRGEVLGFLDASDADCLVTVTVDETVRSMEGVFDVSGVDTAYSSTSLTCPAKGSGIDATTRNIEITPPELYALTLLTAGMSDVQVVIASPVSYCVKKRATPEGFSQTGSSPPSYCPRIWVTISSGRPNARSSCRGSVAESSTVPITTSPLVWTSRCSWPG